MPFCSQCGAPAEGKFCAKCGAPTEPGTRRPDQPAALSDNVAAALCYLLGLVTGILFLLLPPYNQNKTIRFHAFQSIFLNVACIVVSIGLAIVLPFAVEAAVLPLLSLAFLALWVYLIWKAYQNEKVVLPVVGELAEKQA